MLVAPKGLPDVEPDTGNLELDVLAEVRNLCQEMMIGLLALDMTSEARQVYFIFAQLSQFINDGWASAVAPPEGA